MNASPSSDSGSREAKEALKRAEQVTLADFSASLSSGILTAIEARRLSGSSGSRWLPQIWAGWWIGEPPWWAGGRDGGDLPGGGGFPGGGLGGGG